VAEIKATMCNLLLPSLNKRFNACRNPLGKDNRLSHIARSVKARIAGNEGHKVVNLLSSASKSIFCALIAVRGQRLA